MIQFHQDKKHDNHFGLLYGSLKSENKIKEYLGNDLRYSVINDKEEQRISAIVASAGQLGAAYVDISRTAIVCIAIANSSFEMFLLNSGLLKTSTYHGVVICPHCLDEAIATGEEHLAVLRDLKEAIKEHATAKS